MSLLSFRTCPCKFNVLFAATRKEELQYFYMFEYIEIIEIPCYFNSFEIIEILNYKSIYSNMLNCAGVTKFNILKYNSILEAKAIFLK